MNTIHKYNYDAGDPKGIKTRKVIKILKVGKQNHDAGILTVWALVDAMSDADSDTIKFNVYGTGQLIADDEHGEYFDTVFDGQFVWHVFIDGDAS